MQITSPIISMGTLLLRMCSPADPSCPSRLEIGSMVTDCFDFDFVVGLWQGALGHAAREPGSEGWIFLCDPKGAVPISRFRNTTGSRLLAVASTWTFALLTRRPEFKGCRTRGPNSFRGTMYRTLTTQHSKTRKGIFSL